MLNVILKPGGGSPVAVEIVMWGTSGKQRWGCKRTLAACGGGSGNPHTQEATIYILQRAEFIRGELQPAQHHRNEGQTKFLRVVPHT